MSDIQSLDPVWYQLLVGMRLSWPEFRFYALLLLSDIQSSDPAWY